MVSGATTSPKRTTGVLGGVPGAGAVPSRPSGRTTAAAGANAPDPFALLDSLTAQHASSSTSSTQQSSAFDPVDLINQHYRTEALITAHLPRLREAVSQRIDHLDDQIAHTLIRQSETAASTRQHVQDATTAIRTLEHKIRLVQEKAGQSEQAVLSITADMKVLDHVKTHLQRCITTLKRLHMLVHATEELRQTTMVEEGFCDYDKASQLVQAIKLLLTHFAAAQQARVLPLRQLATLASSLQEGMHTSLKHGFRVVAFGSQKTKLLEETKVGRPTPQIKATSSEDEEDGEDEETEVLMPASVLQGGIKFMEALGEPAWVQFRHEFCLDSLGEYGRLFEPPSNVPKEEPQRRVSSFKKKMATDDAETDEPAAGRLENIEERFHWFRQEVLLKVVQEKFADVFPVTWQIEATLARLFLKSTHSHLTALLDPNGQCRDKEAINAPVLLKALQKTLTFEREITAWLERERATTFRTSTTEEAKDDAPSAAIDPLMGVASSAFEDHMGPYIALEEKSMDEQLREALDDRTVDNRGERPVFISSTNLFVYIKGSITRCTALTKGKAFFLLYKAFQNSLKKYANVLQGKLPPQISSSAGGPSSVGLPIPGLVIPSNSNSQALPSYRIPTGEEVTVCHIISTCEYCADTVEALEDLIRDTIDEKYQDKIDMAGDQDAFHEITSKSIRALVSGLMNRNDTALKDLSNTHWSGWDSVGDESDYVRKIHEQVEPFFRTIRSKIPTSYFRSFCDKFAAAFTATYYDTAARLKRISEPGTQQLLLDVYNLKTLFLKLPVLEEGSSTGVPGRKPTAGGSTIAPAMYTKLVQKQFGKIETLLKLVGSPTDLLIENFKVQWTGGSALDFQIVMSLKGMKRPEQVQMLEKFGLDPQTALKGAASNVTGASIVSERVQNLQDQGSNVAAKMSSEMSSMRQKVDDLRRAFRPTG
jgi:hypothetical protein